MREGRARGGWQLLAQEIRELISKPLEGMGVRGRRMKERERLNI